MNGIVTGIFGAIGLGVLVFGLVWMLRSFDRTGRSKPEDKT